MRTLDAERRNERHDLGHAELCGLLDDQFKLVTFWHGLVKREAIGRLGFGFLRGKDPCAHFFGGDAFKRAGIKRAASV